MQVNLNLALEIDQHSIPKPEDIFASLAGGKLFTTLDLSQAYQQPLLDEESPELVTVNTHLGLYRYSRLPFGVAFTPTIFQTAMDQLLSCLTGVRCYLDDIIFTGMSTEEHLKHLSQVLERLQDKGFRLMKDKCHFLQTSVEYLGHVIDTDGLHTTMYKVTGHCLNQFSISHPRPLWKRLLLIDGNKPPIMSAESTSPSTGPTPSHCRSESTHQHIGIALLPRPSQLLWPVLPKCFYDTPSIEPLTAEGSCLDVVQEVRGSVSSHQRPAEFGPGSCSLRSCLTLKSRSGCISLRCWGSDCTKVCRWGRTPNCLRVPDTNARRTEVRSSGWHSFLG